jgi:hypothetical protein
MFSPSMNDTELLMLMQDLEDDEDKDKDLLQAASTIIVYSVLENSWQRIISSNYGWIRRICTSCMFDNAVEGELAQVPGCSSLPEWFIL